MSDLHLDYLPLSQLQTAPRNPKGHALPELASSIGRFGYGEPVVVDERTGRLVAGHGRRESLLKMRDAGEAPPAGIRDAGDDWLVPVVRGWASKSDRDAEAFLVASNRHVELGGWDNEELAKLLQDIDLTGTGFDQDDITRLLDDVEASAPLNGDPDEVPEPPDDADVYVEPGDLYLLGKHRLLCGDATNPDDIARLMDGARAALCLSDPPYGNGEQYASHHDTPENLASLVAAFFPLARQIADVVLLTPGNANQRLYPKPDWTLAWFTPAGTGRGPWGFSCWQPVLAYGKDPFLAAGKGSHPDALVKTESAENDLDHPCPKPIGVWTWLLERGSMHRGDIVFEPFSGSGTTLVACEQTGRVCRALELEPRYVQTAIARWERLTGQKAVREELP